MRLPRLSPFRDLGRRDQSNLITFVVLSGHVLLTGHGPIESALIQRLSQLDLPYAVLVPEMAEALALHDRGIHVMVGQLDDLLTAQAAAANTPLVGRTLPLVVGTELMIVGELDAARRLTEVLGR